MALNRSPEVEQAIRMNPQSDLAKLIISLGRMSQYQSYCRNGMFEIVVPDFRTRRRQVFYFDQNGTRHVDRSPTTRPGNETHDHVTYEPGRYAPADLSKIPENSDLGKILHEHPTARVTRSGAGYSATWVDRSHGLPIHRAANFTGSGLLIDMLPTKSAAFKSGQDNVTAKTPKPNRLMSTKERD